MIDQRAGDQPDSHLMHLQDTASKDQSLDSDVETIDKT